MNIKLKGNLNTTKEKIVFNNGVLDFVARLHKRFNEQRLLLLGARKVRQEAIDVDASVLDFIKYKPSHPINHPWSVGKIPSYLQKRHVEITGPVNKKMVINALNSGADCFMADFEDSNSPTWDNCKEGHVNLHEANRKEISLKTEKKHYYVEKNPAILMVRPRGLHLNEKHLLVDGEEVSASLFDFGVYFYQNAQYLIDIGKVPTFYIPKLEHYQEAAWWNNVFTVAQEELGIPYGTIKATVLIETFPATFQMKEILFELREHILGLNAGRWDQLFSFIKTLKNHKEFVLPERSQVTMKTKFMESYCKLLVKTCHERGAFAMGGMAAQIPIKGDEKANEEALNKVYEDKVREIDLGHDGTWVAHPGLIPVARKAYEKVKTDNQINANMIRDCSHSIYRDDLMEIPEGTVTYGGLKTNIVVGIEYLKAWFEGNGCVPLNNLMEDLATAEISRTQVWQWIKHEQKVFDTGELVDENLVVFIIHEHFGDIDYSVETPLTKAINLFKKVTFSEKLEDFLSISAYDML